MPELNDVIQRILLEGDEEVLAKLSEIAEKGAETIKEISEASEKGGSGFELFAAAIGSVGAAIIGVSAALTNFVDSQDEAIQKTNFLAKAMGTTVAEVSGLEQAFAQAGVSTHAFEQFAQRLTITIAREWPAIAENIRTSAVQQEAAQERVIAATLRVQEAQRNLAQVDEETSSKIVNANLHAEEAYTKLQFSASAALSTMRHDIDSVTSANLGLEAAQQRLAEIQGHPVSDSEKKALQEKQGQLAVDQARQTQIDANTKKLKDQAEARTKADADRQAASDAALKSETAQIEAQTARAKAELQVKEAVTAKSEAETHASQALLKDIPTIRDALDQVAKGGKEVTTAIDLSQVSVTDLTKGIIASAATIDGVLPPPGIEVFRKLVEVLSSKQGELITSAQRLAIVMQLSQRGFSQTGIAASELLGAMERGKEAFEGFTESQSKAFANSPEALENVKKFRDAIAELSNTIGLVNKNFAAAATPTFTAFLKAINESLTQSDGLLHKFVQGIEFVGSAIGNLIDGLQHLFASIDKAFNLEKGRSLQVLLGGLTLFVAAFASAWLGVPAAILVVTTALGYVIDHMKDIAKWADENKEKVVGWGTVIGIVLALFLPIPTLIGLIGAAIVLLVENWDSVKKAFDGFVEAVKNSTVVKWATDFAANLKLIAQYMGLISKSTPQGVGDAKAQAVGVEAGASGNPDGIKLAGGGHVRGPGTSTSDSIIASLSDGEFVNRTAAVQKYGVDFFHSLNNLSFPGFAQGGLVGAPVRMGGGNSGPIQASRVLNLTIGDRTFSGFRAPANVVESLSNYAVSRQASAAGRQPSWVK